MDQNRNKDRVNHIHIFLAFSHGQEAILCQVSWRFIYICENSQQTRRRCGEDLQNIFLQQNNDFFVSKKGVWRLAILVAV